MLLLVLFFAFILLFCFPFTYSIILPQQQNPTPVNKDTIPDSKTLEELTLIGKRLENWFVKQSLSSAQFTGNVKARWDSLQKQVDKAHEKFCDLEINERNDVITGIFQ